jgi:hypothetical protein
MKHRHPIFIVCHKKENKPLMTISIKLAVPDSSAETSLAERMKDLDLI